MWRGVIGLVVALSVPAGAADPGPVLHYEDGLLTVEIERVPLDRVVGLLEQEVGVTVSGELGDPRDVTKRFDEVPLPEALDRLLGQQNFIVRYDSSGEPAAVELHGVPQPRSAPTRAAKRPAVSALSLLAGAPLVPLPPSLRTALRADHARPSRLLRAALNQPDATVRHVAMQAFLTALAANAGLRKALAGSDPSSLQPLFRAAPAAQSDGLLAELGTRSRDPTLRSFFSRLRTKVEQERAARGTRARG